MSLATGDDKVSESSSSLQWPQRCRHFEFHEIQLATENFDESLVIGRGGFGKVYKGTIVNGSSPIVAAVKRLDSMSDQGATEFWAEVEMLSKLRHSHLVSLIGYCNDGKEMILVYEYMPHGTLEDHLHKLCTPLSWLQRLKICIGAARGLDYLHTGTGIEVGVIHRDVKSSNILLHESWAAKISDFGLCRIGPKNRPLSYVNTLVKGTFGYLDPDYFSTGRLTRKSDVYAFGVVLFEVLCRKRAVDRSLDEEQWGLWAQESIKGGGLNHIIDLQMKDQISPKCLKEFARIADRCLHSHPKQRPTMAEVVVNLESVLALQEKNNDSSQLADKTLFGRMVDMFSFPSNGENSDYRVSSPGPKVFKFADLKRTTRNFSQDMLLGKGSSGKVFLGWVDRNTFAPSSSGVGMAVAVKMCSQANSQADAEWLAEVSFLGRLAHPNIVRLLGYCINKQGKLLVYEYMQNGRFDRFLFTNASVIVEPLSWGARIIIMMGVACGLTYWHLSGIYHNLTSSSILLDQDFNAKLKLWNIGSGRSGPEIGNPHVTNIVVTWGYVDPEHIRTGYLGVKSDMYSFGVVLLETLTGLRAIDTKRSEEQHNLVEWASPMLSKERELKKIMDPRLEQTYPIEGALQCAALVLRCVADNPQDRPSSEQVLHSLKQIYALVK